jgi:nucleotide-binding universal stress UspA family protein
MFKNILLAVDGSEHSLHAARLSGDLAREMTADMYVVVSFDPVPKYLGDPLLQQAISARIQEAEQILQPALVEVGEIPGALRTEILEGPPAEAILSVAEVRGADLIIMGVRGLGRLAGLVLGSQSQKVVANAACPVLLVH